jgi:predicted nucleic acid-binding protein
MTQWMQMRRWGTSNRDVIRRWLDRVLLLPYDRRVATVWGELRGDAAHRGRPTAQNATWIAACCLVEGLPLATRNVKDYAGFAEHDRLRLVTE